MLPTFTTRAGKTGSYSWDFEAEGAGELQKKKEIVPCLSAIAAMYVVHDVPGWRATALRR
jgi:hypothetical protein